MPGIMHLFEWIRLIHKIEKGSTLIVMPFLKLNFTDIFKLIYTSAITAFLIFINCINKFSNRSKRNILAPSLSAMDGSGWVSMNNPSAPVAMAALAIVPINWGLPPVTPLVWLGCCRLCVQSMTTGTPAACIIGIFL
jgi:hypothetical protein